MGVICKKVYVDKNGEKASSFYNNLHLGRDVAERMYIESVKDYAFSKAQKVNMTVDELISRSKKFKLNEDETKYIDPDGTSLDRTTGALGTVLPNNDDEFFRKKTQEKAIQNKALSLILNDPEAYGYTEAQVRNKAKVRVNVEDETGGGLATKHAQDWANKHPRAYENKVKEIQDLYDFKRDAGTDAHRVAENYVLERNKLEVDENGYRDLEKATERALSGEENKKEYRKLIKDIEKFLNGVGYGKKVEFYPEVMIGDAVLGVAGSIDLLAVTEDGEVMIFDYKTKEKGKEYMFDKSFGRLKGPMSQIKNNRESHGALQTSVYRLILERAGFKVIDSKILYIEADIDKTGAEFKYEGFKHKKDVVLDYHRSELVKFFVERGVRGIDKPRTHVEGMINNSTELINQLKGVDEEDKYDVEDKIKRALEAPKLDKRTNKEYYYDRVLDRNVYYKSKNVSERKAELKEYFQKEATLTNELAKKVISYFNKKDRTAWKGKLSDGYVRQSNDLLAGASSDTHTIRQVSSIPGYGSVDPNILVLVERTNGAATFVHLSSKFNENIDFDSPKHTTVFGQYLVL
jgi:hypothetical protein